MKFISVLAVVMTWLATACASEPNTAKDKVVYSSPTAEETAQFDEWLLNGQGKLDAISAKYNVSRDTMLKIMMGYSGMDSIKPTIVFPDLLTRKKAGPAQVITADLARQYRLPYSTVGRTIYDMKALELSAQSRTDE
jgi:hypothetical protein